MSIKKERVEEIREWVEKKRRKDNQEGSFGSAFLSINKKPPEQIERTLNFVFRSGLVSTACLP